MRILVVICWMLLLVIAGAISILSGIAGYYGDLPSKGIWVLAFVSGLMGGTFIILISSLAEKGIKKLWQRTHNSKVN